jgi:GT2 family glycosyltransferase
MNSYDLVMITTFINDKHIYKLCESIVCNNESNLNLLVILVEQSTSVSEKCIQKNTNYTEIEIIKAGKNIGLSSARNLALHFIKQHNVSFNFVMFPDDDTTFDKDFFLNFKNVVEPDKNLLIPFYNEGTFIPYKKFNLKNKTPLSKNDFKYVGSPNIVIFNQVIYQDVMFDELLGVGSKFGSSEDVDFYFKSFDICPFIFTNQLYNFHPAKTDRYSTMSYNEIIKRFRAYSSGYIYVMLKYKKKFPLLNILLTTIGAALLNFFKGNWKMCRAYTAQFFIRMQLIFQTRTYMRQKNLH